MLQFPIDSSEGPAPLSSAASEIRFCLTLIRWPVRHRKYAPAGIALGAMDMHEFHRHDRALVSWRGRLLSRRLSFWNANSRHGTFYTRHSMKLSWPCIIWFRRTVDGNSSKCMMCFLDILWSEFQWKVNPVKWFRGSWQHHICSALLGAAAGPTIFSLC